MKKVITVLMSALLLSKVSAQLPEADQILNKSRDLSQVGSMTATINLTITEKNGAVRNRTIVMTTKSFPGGQEKRMVKFTDPPDVKGTAMLIIDNEKSSDEIWIYLPALKKTRRISSSENSKSFMSSEFTNADMASPTLSDFKNRHLEGSGTNNKWIIESVPVNDDKADEYGYSRKITYISMDKYQAQKMDFYNFDNVLFKSIEIRKFYNLSDGKYMVSDMTASNYITNRKSEIVFKNIAENIRIEDTFFTVQNLER